MADEMKTYRIYFLGLILHIEHDGKGHSAVVLDKHHKAKILYVPADKNYEESVSLKEIPFIQLLGEDLVPGYAKRTTLFESAVPSAKRIMGAWLENGAKVGTGRKATYFHHVEGDLSVARYYLQRQVKYFRREDDISAQVAVFDNVASLTCLQVKSSKPVSLLIGSTAPPVPLEPGSCILVANTDPRKPPKHDSENQPHFRKYSRLLGGSNTSITIKSIKHPNKANPLESSIPDHCDWVEKYLCATGYCARTRAECRNVHPRTSAHPECANSAWP